MQPDLKVLFLAAEADPFIKVGGLGDMAGSLPPALRQVSLEDEGRALDVRLVIPFHGAVQRQHYPLRSAAVFGVRREGGLVRAEALSMEWNGMTVYMITGEPIDPDAPVYTPDPSVDAEKFTFFSLAALELARTLQWSPDLVHANDWHTAPAIYSLYLHRKRDPFYSNTTTLLGLHNLPYLGVGAGAALQAYGLPPAGGSALPEWAWHMPLPLGLLAADHIVASSPNYAREIQAPEFGAGLHDFLRLRRTQITGILNGIDYDRWNPATDPAIAACYDADHLEQRAANKAALQAEFGLEVNPRIPLLAMVTRMDFQKGVDLLPEALHRLAGNKEAMPWQTIILGTGNLAIEAAARRLEIEFPQQVRAAIRFDSALSRRIYAGADMLLIPSRYEPCGLVQMIAMRYGCVPVARATGGLRDTIHDVAKSAENTGFLFQEASPAALATAIHRALQSYEDPDGWRRLQRRGMNRNFSWAQFAREYLALYRSLVSSRMEPSA